MNSRFIIAVFAGLAVLCISAPSLGQYGEASEKTSESLAPAQCDSTATTAEKDWGVSLGLAFNTKYVSRGFLTTDGPVLEPTASVSYKGLSLTAWNNTNLTHMPSCAHGCSEYDYTLAYAWKAGNLDYSVGTIYYQFVHAEARSTLEVFGSICFGGALSPRITVYQDVHVNYGAYVTGAISHTFEDVWKPRDGVAMDIALSGQVAWGSAGQNDFNLGVKKPGPADAIISAGVPFRIGEHLTITPAANLTFVLDDDIRARVPHPTVFFYGITTTYCF
jgi:hypothetical protein